jgi:ubiquinone/menaquinone biosynthesis C-methylase UbiE/predicted  nucleic acid-binding Zn-ribbon protein
LPEFTGERVIPGLVDADLLNEHLARYLFAKHFISRIAQPANVFDAGCGSGYGSAELAKTGASVTGADVSGEAVAYAREHFGAQGIRFVEAPCESLPFEPESFDLVTAFEVIEHLERWQELLTEANRVLKPGGVLLVSTPNRDYYTESRGEAGPNPFHVHEFDYPEFQAALNAIFPHVRLWTQNHADAIVFAPPTPEGASLEASVPSDPAGAHFYLAACSRSPIAVNEIFTWTPSSGNVLREREKHIARLTGELRQKDAWLQQNIAEHTELQSRHEGLTEELKSSNNWAAGLTRQLEERGARVVELQRDLDSRLDWAFGLMRDLETRNSRIVELQREVDSRLEWVRALESQVASAASELERLRSEIGRLQSEITGLQNGLAAQQHEAKEAVDRLQTTVDERTARVERLDAELSEIHSSFWYRAGARLGLCPRPRDGQ